MKIKAKVRLIVLVLLVIAALGFYLYSERIGQPPEEAPLPEEIAPPPVRHPVPEPLTSPQPPPEPDDEEEAPEVDVLEIEPEPPPGLDQSDEIIRRVLSGMLEEELVEVLVAPDQIVPRLVLGIDSLDGAAIPLRMRPVAHVPGLPVVEEDNDRIRLAEANQARYGTHLDALERVDLDQLVEFYFAHYHWFQQAYEELGYPEAYFNDRLVDVIDHLLAAPTPPRQPELTRPEVLYEFADPHLETQSWGRKALYRVGPEQAGEIKNWLRELRARLTGEFDPDPAPPGP